MKTKEINPTKTAIKTSPISNPMLSSKLREVIPDFLKLPGSYIYLSI
jgi:hypothetical protein